MFYNFCHVLLDHSHNSLVIYIFYLSITISVRIFYISCLLRRTDMFWWDGMDCSSYCWKQVQRFSSINFKIFWINLVAYCVQKLSLLFSIKLLFIDIHFVEIYFIFLTKLIFQRHEQSGEVGWFKFLINILSGNSGTL